MWMICVSVLGKEWQEAKECSNEMQTKDVVSTVIIDLE